MPTRDLPPRRATIRTLAFGQRDRAAMRLVFLPLRWCPPVALPRGRLARWTLALALVALLGPGNPAAADPTQTIIEVVGDSQAQGLAAALQRRYMRSDKFRVLDRSRIATGIAVHANFDWPNAARALAADHHVDIAVMMFGANDRPSIRRNGRIDPELREQYREAWLDEATPFRLQTALYRWDAEWNYWKTVQRLLAQNVLHGWKEGEPFPPLESIRPTAR